MNKPSLLKSGGHFVAAAGLAVVLCLLATDSAQAHAQLIKSNPSDKTDLDQPPTQVELWFNELLDEGFNSIEVISAADLNAKKAANFAKGQPKLDPKDHTHLTVAVSVLKPGKYVIQYRVLSRDGHTAPGRLTFQISPTNS